MCHREFGVDLNGVLEKRHSGDITTRVEDLKARAIRFQSFERRRGSLGEGSAVFFDRGERFADSGSEFTGNSTQRVQNVFLSGCLRLLSSRTSPVRQFFCA